MVVVPEEALEATVVCMVDPVLTHPMEVWAEDMEAWADLWAAVLVDLADWVEVMGD